MISGIGVDISLSSRFDGMEDSLLEKMFTKREIERAPERRRSEYFASRFAAKEAFAKSLGTGIRGFSLLDIEVVENEDGKPYFELSSGALEIARGKIFNLSISHDGGLCIAMVTAEYEK